MKPEPFQSVPPPDRSCRSWFTTTPLGAPVVPDVYMMSIDPWEPGGRGSAEVSGWNSVDQSTVPGALPVVATILIPSTPPARSDHRVPAPGSALARTKVGSAWMRIERSSGPASLVLTGTATAPAR